MGDWNTIAGWRASAMSAIGNDVTSELNKLKGTEAELRDAATPRVWDGEGAEAAARSLKGIEAGVLHRVEEFASLRAAVDDAAERIKQLQLVMTDLQETARTNDLQIVDGKVVPRADAGSTGPGQGSPATDPELKAGLEAHVEQIIRTGLDIDADLTMVMLSIVDGKGWSDPSTMAAAAEAGAKAGDSTMVEPPKNGSPEQNRAWWDSLSSAERKWLINNKPGSVGNMKGLPYRARHQANVNRLESERERLEKLHAKLSSKEGMLDRVEEVGAAQAMKEFRALEAKLDAIDVLDKQAKNDNLMMSLDFSGERVRAAVGIGDIDNADYLNVHTPGMNSAVERNMERYVNEFSEVTKYAENMLRGTDKSVGTVVWMDYLPPEASIDGTSIPSTEAPEGLDDARAEAGAKRLAAELEGIQASRFDDPPDRLTATGHSYGSLTTAYALRQTDAADAFLSQGSPGWGDQQSAGLKVPSGELYNMRTHDDFLVAEVGVHGGSVDRYEDVRQLGTQDALSADGESLRGSSGHSGYTVAGQGMSTSEYNTAAVIAGRDELVIDVPIRSEHTDTR